MGQLLFFHCLYLAYFSCLKALPEGEEHVKYIFKNSTFFNFAFLSDVGAALSLDHHLAISYQKSFDNRVELKGSSYAPTMRVKRLDFNKVYSLNGRPVDASVKALISGGLPSFRPALNLFGNYVEVWVTSRGQT